MPSPPPAARVVMLSGANRGIGLATARALSAAGWQLSLGVRGPEHVPALSPPPLVCRYDAFEAGDAAAWLARTLSRFGRLDGLVNNAGVLAPLPLGSDDDAALRRMLEVNALAPWRLTGLALPELARTGGRVVDIVSVSGLRATTPEEGGYCVSKFAAMGVSRVAHQAGLACGVGVTALCPGWVATEMSGASVDEGALSPEEVARAVRYILESPASVDMPELILNDRSCPPR